MRFLIVDDATIGRNAYFAISESIQGIYRFVRGNTRRQVNQYLYVARCQVFYLLYLDFAFFACLYNRVANTGYRFPVRNFFDSKCLIINLFNFSAYAYRTATFSVIVFRNVDAAACLEIRIQFEFLFMQIVDGCIAKFIEVMGKYFG